MHSKIMLHFAENPSIHEIDLVYGQSTANLDNQAMIFPFLTGIQKVLLKTSPTHPVRSLTYYSYSAQQPIPRFDKRLGLVFDSTNNSDSEKDGALNIVALKF
jgi:hypothetical protein